MQGNELNYDLFQVTSQGKETWLNDVYRIEQFTQFINGQEIVSTIPYECYCGSSFYGNKPVFSLSQKEARIAKLLAIASCYQFENEIE